MSSDRERLFILLADRDVRAAVTPLCAAGLPGGCGGEGRLWEEFVAGCSLWRTQQVKYQTSQYFLLMHKTNYSALAPIGTQDLLILICS